MKFGFVTSALKEFGKAALPIAEQIGIQAANTAAPGLGGMLANLAVNGINSAIAKHGALPPTAPAPSDPTITVGQASKFDVMQLLEANAPEILNLILSGQNKAVVDRTRFVAGADKIVEGVLDVMKSIGAVPSTTPMTDPVVITPAVVRETAEAPAPKPVGFSSILQPLPVAPAPAPAFTGVISNLEVAKSSSPLDLASLLEQAVAQLRAR